MNRVVQITMLTVALAFAGLFVFVAQKLKQPQDVVNLPAEHFQYSDLSFLNSNETIKEKEDNSQSKLDQQEKSEKPEPAQTLQEKQEIENSANTEERELIPTASSSANNEETDDEYLSIWSQVYSLLQPKTKTEQKENSLVSSFLDGNFSVSPNQNLKINSFALFSDKDGSLKKYGNEIGLVLKRHFETNKNQLEIMENFFKNPDQMQMKMEELAQKYDEVAKVLSKITPPEKAKNLHVKLVDAIDGVSKEMKNLAQTRGEENLYKAILNYNKQSFKAAKIFADLGEFFKSYGVVFEKNEPGSMFLLGNQL